MSRPRRVSRRDEADINRFIQQKLLEDILMLELHAGRLGMHVTARALNQARNALGWEMAGDILAAGRAARGQRSRKEGTK